MFVINFIYLEYSVFSLGYTALIMITKQTKIMIAIFIMIILINIGSSDDNVNPNVLSSLLLAVFLLMPFFTSSFIIILYVARKK